MPSRGHGPRNDRVPVNHPPRTVGCQRRECALSSSSTKVNDSHVTELGTTEPHRRWATRLSIGELGVVFPLIVLMAVFYFHDPAFLSSANVVTMLQSAAYTGIVAVGMTFLMVAREIDLSVGSVVGLAAIVWSHLIVISGLSIALSTVLVLVGAAGLGLVNATLAVRLHIPSLIVTLGMLFVARGLVYVISDGYSISPLPESIVELGRLRILGLPVSVLVFLLAVVVGEIVLRLTITGRRVIATGGNENAAQVVGISTDRVKTACFVLTAVAAAVAGMFFVAQVRSGEPTLGNGLELDVIAAIVIGGVSLLGGVGRVVGTLIGVALMQVVRSGMIFVGVESNWQNVVVGCLLLIAVAVDVTQRRRGSLS